MRVIPLTAAWQPKGRATHVMCMVLMMLALCCALLPRGARAQTFGQMPATAPGLWIQVEARPNLGEAIERANAYASFFPETLGFSLVSGWHAIVLGPYGQEEAPAALAALLRQNLIPADSYITDGREFTGQYWPQGLRGEIGATPVAPPEEITTIPLDGPPDQTEPALPSQTPPAVAPPAGVPPSGAPETPQPPLSAPADVFTILPGTAPEAPPAPQVPPSTDLRPAPGVFLPDGGQSPPRAEVPDESPAEARVSEGRLTRGERQDLQNALAWFGFYRGAVDGAFGPASREAMAAWQSAFALPATGVLTARERAILIESHRAENAEFGFETVEDREAGITATLPLALVEFDRYAPPFVHYRAKDGSGSEIWLISLPGDRTALAALYAQLQAREEMPASGERNLGENDFNLFGFDENRVAQAYVRLERGEIKGWMHVSRPEHAHRDERVIQILAQSFTPKNGQALDPGMVALDAGQREGLAQGLDPALPRHSLSGFYVSAEGAVFTAYAPLAQCAKITLDKRVEAELRFHDPESGVALLMPKSPLAAPAHAGFRQAPLTEGLAVNVSGYAYGARLPAPVLTPGSLRALSDLEGDARRVQLAVPTLAGDSGGPVLDATGAVIGLLAAAPAGDARQLPKDVQFAVTAPYLQSLLERAGIAPTPAAQSAELPPETLHRRANALTVLVSCWP